MSSFLPSSRSFCGILTLLPALMFPVAAAVSDEGRSVDSGKWRATRVRSNRTVTQVTGEPRRLPLTKTVEPIHRESPSHVSTWSRIRRADARRSPLGVEWPALHSVVADAETASMKADIEQVAHSQTLLAGPQCPPSEPPGPDRCDCELSHTWQLLPPGLLFKSYMAGTKESRLGTVTLHQTHGDTLQESTLGARVGIVRWGTPGAINPEGWQIDFEGAAFLRQNWSEDLDVDALDFRYGVPLTWRRGPWAVKFSFYHLSAHVGDEFLIRNPAFRRRNYVRDALILGTSYHITPDWRLYGEAGYAVHTDGGAEPWEFQFGAEYSPVIRRGIKGSPFFAINAHLREEVDYGGGVNVMAGWQWRSAVSDRVFRLGAQYYNGKSLQYSFFNLHEQLIGGGIWYDF